MAIIDEIKSVFMGNSLEKAMIYFQKLWDLNSQKLLDGDIEKAVMKDGAMDPVEYCLTTVVRLVKQEGNFLENLERILELFGQFKTQFIYPIESVHFTLGPCTLRFRDKSIFTAEKIEKIRKIVQKVLEGKRSVKFLIKGVGVVGNQVFLQVYPYDNSWILYREELEMALKDEGEKPLSYPDKSPVHINLMRITDASDLEEVYRIVKDNREVDVGEVEVKMVDYVLADFVLSHHSSYISDFKLIQGES